MGLFETPSRSLIREYGDIYREKADRFAEETRLLFTQGKLSDAEERVRELITFQSKVVGERHPEYATGLCMLAEILSAKDEVADAETLLQRALEIRKKALGENHPDYASSLDQMARLMLRWEDLSGAEPLLRKALEIRKAALGVDHPGYAESLAGLAGVLFKGGSPGEAESLLRESLAALRRAHGEGHPATAATLMLLADVLQCTSLYGEAEACLVESIEIFKKEYGEAHPEHLAGLSALAGLFQKRGDLSAAEPIWRLLLDMKRPFRGPNAPDRAHVQTQLGLLLQRRGDLKGAEDLFRQALETIKETSGERHDAYASGLTHLGQLLQRAEDHQGAETSFRQALAVRKEVLGTRHPDYATSLVHLAQLVQKRGDVSWARMLLREAVDVRRAVLGEGHADYAQSLAALGDLFAQQGDIPKAEETLREALRVRRLALGENHPVYASNLSSLAAVLRRRGDFEGAEALLRDALQIRKTSIGQEHPDYAMNLGNLAWLLQRKGDRPGAEDLLSQALEIRRRLLGDQHPDYQQGLQRLKSLRETGPSADVSREPSPAPAPAHVSGDSADPTGSPPPYLPSPSRPEFGGVPVEGDEPTAVPGEPVGGGAELADVPAGEPGHPEIPTTTLAVAEQDGEDGGTRGPWPERPDAAEQAEAEEPAPETWAVDGGEPAGEDRPVGSWRHSDGTRLFDEATVGELAETRASEVDLFLRAYESLDESADVDRVDEPSSTEGHEVPTAAPVYVPPDESSDVSSGAAGVPVAEGVGPESPTAVGPFAGDGTPSCDPPASGRVEPESVTTSIHPVPDFGPMLVGEEAMPGVASAEDSQPARSFSMSQNSSHLSQELAGMSDRFSELGERLLTVARQLHAPGTPPPGDLLATLGACRDDFQSLRDRTRDLADSLAVSCPPAEQLANLQDLTGLLDLVAEAEIHQSKSEEQRRRSLSVLDRVLTLGHATVPDFAPLRECHEMARGLRDAIAGGNWKSLPDEAERIAEGQHHFADLLSLIEDRDELADDTWAGLHESVGQAFGKPLAAAAARSKLVLPAGGHSGQNGDGAGLQHAAAH